MELNGSTQNHHNVDDGENKVEDEDEDEDEMNSKQGNENESGDIKIKELNSNNSSIEDTHINDDKNKEFDEHKHKKKNKYCEEIPILLYRKNKFPRECLGPGSLCVTPNIKDDLSDEMDISDNESFKDNLIKVQFTHPLINDYSDYN